MSVLAIITIFVALSMAANNYSIISTWSSVAGSHATSCSGSPSSVVVVPTPNNCVTTGCVCSTGGGTVDGCSVTTCGATALPSTLPPAPVIFAAWNDALCTSNVSFYIAVANSQCFPLGNDSTAPSSSKIVCGSGNINQLQYNSFDCSGASSPGTLNNFPYPGPSCTAETATQGFYVSCSGASCFHKDSTINYHDETMTLPSLKIAESSSCAVPHVIVGEGVKIKTTCSGVLRVTHDHLVMTVDGYKQAGLLQVGDKLYSKVHAANPECEITEMETELNQQYFGLNCEDSDVTADGYWTSTFGRQHQLPATWMKVVSKIIGVKRASAIGDYFASKASQWGLV